ncbi:multidrug efflux pump subunit AcrB [Litorivivens lipolytica]|uniref:Multidrug efflux pump subunit AcrB n=1 Tax=Litorivivens lipolytica TaxID=1524264 RepID=A0A7W4W3H6_9GAMM|nr:multidrug efflux pump subunit AcrB [Litorivivens lipolytica]
MHALIRWFVHNPVAANLMMWVLLIAGGLTLTNTYREEFPNLATDVVRVTVPYLGASPAEVEESVCIRVEEAIEGTPNIKKILTTAQEGACVTRVELEGGADKGKVVDDIKSRVDGIDSFPEDAEEPQVKEEDILTHVLHILLSGKADERSLKELAYQIRDDIVELPGVSQAEVTYVRPYEMSIEVSEHTLRRYGLTLERVADAIRASSLDLPGGAVKTESGEVLLRTKAQAYSARDFEEIIVLTRDDGSVVTLGDIADVVDGFKDQDLRVRFDGSPAVMIQVKRIGREDVINLAERVKTYLEQAEADLPEGITMTLWKDESQDLVDRLELLRTNAGSGLLLVLLVLSLFLKPNLAFWVAVGIPVALAGSLLIFPFAEIAISTMSILAFILVLGILVDDAVVVAERIYAHQLKGLGPKEAAVAGTQEVSLPVIFGVLTSMVAFMPFLFIDVTMGAWFAVLGVVVIAALFFSIVESQLILPVHLSHRILTHSRRHNRESWLPRQLQALADHIYKPILQFTLRWRYLALAVGIAGLIAVSGLVASGRLTLQYFPNVVGERLYATLTMPAGTEKATMLAKVQQIEQAAYQLKEELDAELAAGEPSRVKHVLSSIGAPLIKGSIGDDTFAGGHFAEVALEILNPDDYDLDPNAIVARWRELSGVIPGALEMTFTASAFSVGKALDLQLRGDSTEDLRQAAAILKNALAELPGVFDITDTFRPGKLEIQLDLKPEARTLGLTTAALANQVREAFYGLEVQRIQRGPDDVRVMVRFPESERRSIGDIEDMMIRTDSGAEVPFNSVAKVSMGRGFSSIQRVDGKQVVSVQANIDRTVNTPEAIIEHAVADILPQIVRDFPAVEYSLAGEAEERASSLASLLRNMLIALFVIYSLLAIPLKSYFQPFIIMGVIPFGLIGSLLGHYLLGYDLIFWSLLGIVAMAGVVVNSGLVLVDYINQRRSEGMNVRDAAIEAGVVRFRPIILTSLTTFVGLIPLITNHTLTTFMFVPLAVSLAFGVLIASAVNLLMVPASYLILEDILRLFSGRREEETEEELTT